MTETRHLRSDAGTSCTGLTSPRALGAAQSSVQTQLLASGVVHPWTVEETARTIAAGDWQVSLRIENGGPNQAAPTVRVRVERRNSSCAVQQTIVDETFSTSNSGTATFSTSAVNPGQVTFAAGDRLVVIVNRDNATNRTATLRFAGGSPDDSALVHPAVATAADPVDADIDDAAPTAADTATGTLNVAAAVTDPAPTAEDAADVAAQREVTDWSDWSDWVEIAAARRFLRPFDTVDAGNWTAENAATLHEAVGGETADDGTFARSPQTGEEAFTVDLDGPGLDEIHAIRFRRRAETGFTDPVQLRVELLDGTDVVQTWTPSAFSGTSWVQIFLAVTETIPADPDFRVRITRLGAGTRAADVSWVELDTDAPAPPTTDAGPDADSNVDEQFIRTATVETFGGAVLVRHWQQGATLPSGHGLTLPQQGDTLDVTPQVPGTYVFLHVVQTEAGLDTDSFTLTVVVPVEAEVDDPAPPADDSAAAAVTVDADVSDEAPAAADAAAAEVSVAAEVVDAAPSAEDAATVALTVTAEVGDAAPPAVDAATVTVTVAATVADAAPAAVDAASVEAVVSAEVTDPAPAAQDAAEVSLGDEPSASVTDPAPLAQDSAAATVTVTVEVSDAGPLAQDSAAVTVTAPTLAEISDPAPAATDSVSALVLVPAEAEITDPAPLAQDAVTATSGAVTALDTALYTFTIRGLRWDTADPRPVRWDTADPFTRRWLPTTRTKRWQPTTRPQRHRTTTRNGRYRETVLTSPWHPTTRPSRYVTTTVYREGTPMTLTAVPFGPYTVHEVPEGLMIQVHESLRAGGSQPMVLHGLTPAWTATAVIEPPAGPPGVERPATILDPDDLTTVDPDNFTGAEEGWVLVDFADGDFDTVGNHKIQLVLERTVNERLYRLMSTNVWTPQVFEGPGSLVGAP